MIDITIDFSESWLFCFGIGLSHSCLLRLFQGPVCVFYSSEDSGGGGGGGDGSSGWILCMGIRFLCWCAFQRLFEDFWSVKRHMYV